VPSTACVRNGELYQYHFTELNIQRWPYSKHPSYSDFHTHMTYELQLVHFWPTSRLYKCIT